MRIGIDARMYGSAVTGIGIYVKELTQTLFEIDKKNDYVVFLLPDAFKNFCSPRFGVSAVCVDTPWYGWREQLILPWQMARDDRGIASMSSSSKKESGRMWLKIEELRN